jgi:hypothetical protein
MYRQVGGHLRLPGRSLKRVGWPANRSSRSDDLKVGAGGRTRTDTTFYGPRILSPVRLPFRHTGGCPKR